MLQGGENTQMGIYLPTAKKEAPVLIVGLKMDTLELFNVPLKEKTGEIQNTHIEYLVIGFDQDKKRTIIKMLEKLCDENKIEVYADYLFKIVKEKYEENNT